MTERDRAIEIAEEIMRDVHTRQKNCINGLLEPELVSMDTENRSVTIRFQVRPWEVNRRGILHGGIMATMLDHVMGVAVSAYLQTWAPTLSLDIEYIRSANVGDSLLVQASAVSIGRRIIRMQGEIRNESTGKLLATCTSSFFNREE